jgi:hypothetical protein
MPIDQAVAQELSNLILGVISNVIYGGVIRPGAAAVRRQLTKPDAPRPLRPLLEESPEVRTVLQKAAVAVARAPIVEREGLADRLRLFLVSPEVEALTQQIYASDVAGSAGANLPAGSEATHDSIQQEFALLLSFYLDSSLDAVHDLGYALFNALDTVCAQALAAATSRGSLGAHEALSARRAREVRDYLAVIDKNVAFLTQNRPPSATKVLDFELQCRGQIKVRHGSITPPNVDDQVRVPINTLFVQPRLVPLPAPNSKLPSRPPVPLEAVLGRLRRAVILGTPGGGKSTSALKVCNDLVDRYTDRLCAGRLLTPFYVVLREYANYKKATPSSIVEYIEVTARARYQLAPPPGAVEYLLLNGRALVVFDGLDELLDTTDRREITGDVESFCALYPTAPVLVTSREIGYEQAPLSTDTFDSFRLAPFDEEQVTEYVRKWFTTDKTLEPEEQTERAAAFVRESAVVSDLRSNPLMLSLMCRIYRGENYIPQNRPDVYDKCANMLFEQWDKGRGIMLAGAVADIKAHVRPAMMYIAYWIYSDDALQGGVTELALVDKIADYLVPRRYEDIDEATIVAREFVAFLRGRAWVLSDVGLTNGDRLYQFTHRTFLEYFTAAHLVRTHETPELLAGVLLPRVAREEWDVVAQLALQLQNKQVEDAGDAVLRLFVTGAAGRAAREVGSILSFCARCLRFMIPSPATARDITAKCIEWCVGQAPRAHGVHKRAARKPERESGERSMMIVGALTSVARENARAVTQEVEARITDAMQNEEEAPATAALDIAFHAEHLPYLADGVVPTGLEYWRPIRERVSMAFRDRIIRLSQRSLWLSQDAQFLRLVTYAEVVAWHGVSGLFRETHYPVFSMFTRIAVVDNLIARMFRRDYGGPDEQLEENYGQLGAALSDVPPPWAPGEWTGVSWFTNPGTEGVQVPSFALSPAGTSADVNFAFLSLLALIVERMPDNARALGADGASLEACPMIGIALSRLKPRDENRVDDADRMKALTLLSTVRLREAQATLMASWIEGTVNLVSDTSAPAAMHVASTVSARKRPRK